MELWEIANLLGLNEPGNAAPGAGPARDLIAERLHAAAHGLPQPEPDRPSAPPPGVGNLSAARQARGAR